MEAPISAFFQTTVSTQSSQDNEFKPETEADSIGTKIRYAKIDYMARMLVSSKHRNGANSQAAARDNDISFTTVHKWTKSTNID